MLVVEAGARAREAFDRRDWRSAYEAFRACDELGADDHDALAESAHWLGLADEAIESYAEAYRLHLENGTARRASLSAFMLAIYLRLRGDGAQPTGGWPGPSGCSRPRRRAPSTAIRCISGSPGS